MALSEKRRLYIKEWKKKARESAAIKKLTEVDLEAQPLPESIARRRCCRICGSMVEAKSYWYCNTHNRLSGVSEDLEYADTYSPSCSLSDV